MFGLIRLVLQFIWLAIMVMGIRKAIELAQQGTDDLVRGIERGDNFGLAGTVVRVYEALQQREKTGTNSE
jgi:hypothetical protein